MKNTFLEALIAKLEAMNAEGEQPSVGKVIATVVHTAVEQKLTYDVKRDILECLMALDADGITRQEVEILRALDDSAK